MSPKSTRSHRDAILNIFNSRPIGNCVNDPILLTIQPNGTIISLTEKAKKFIKKVWMPMESGDNCFNLITTKNLPPLLKEISRILDYQIPGFFSYSHRKSSYNFFLTPLFSTDGKFDRIQVLISEETKISHLSVTSKNIFPESEQQFIYKLIKSLGKSPNTKYALSRMIRSISKFLDFDYAEAWEVGYDKNMIFKNAVFAKKNSVGKDESITRFRRGQGLPGITLKSEKVEIWDDLQQDQRFLRKEPILKDSITLGIGVPILYENEVIAVLTFFGRPIQKVHELKGIMERISFQVSAFVKRKISENQLNNMFRFSPNLIAVVGLDGYLKKVNPAFIRIFGFTENELLNTPFNKFLHEKDKISTYERLNEVAGGLTPRSFQNRCRTSSGEYKWISWTPSELMEEEGVVHIFGLDISIIKKNNQELLKYRNIVESSKDGIGLYTLDDGEVFFNNAFRKVLGYSEENLTGAEAIKKIYMDNDQAKSVLKYILKGNFWEGDIQIKDSNKNFHDYYFSGGPILNENDEMIAVFGIHTDISERKKYESSLKEYGNRINNVLESITDGFFSLNNEEEVTYWNKAAEELLLVPRNKILNQKLWDFFPVKNDPIFHQKYQEALSANQKISFEHFVQYLGIWVEVNVYPGKDGLSSYFKDISDRKRAEEEIRIAQERYILVSKATREAVYDWDLTLNTLEWSNTYYVNYGYDPVPVTDTLLQWEQQIHIDDRDEVIAKLNSALSGKDSEWICEYKFIQANRKIAVVLERGYILRDDGGKAIRMIGALQDITTLKQNERALEELNFQLKKHSAELLQSNAELEQFAYIASHDLQEPLRMVTSFLTLLQKQYNEELDDKARQYIHFATDGAVRMRQIILDLLDYSRVGKLKYELELIDVNSILQDITLLHENMILEKKAVIEFSDLPFIKGAAIPLLRVLSNLISNSIKYSREGVSPVIKIAVKDLDSHWEFIITDNGIGINSQFKEKIFVIFQRLHSRDEYSGTGIGLAICKKIVENHGGKIWVNSIEGAGSSFHFTIQKHF